MKKYTFIVCEYNGLDIAKLYSEHDKTIIILVYFIKLIILKNQDKIKQI